MINKKNALNSRPPKKSKSDVFFPLTVDCAPLLSLIERTEDRRTVEDLISRIAQSRRQRNHQLSAVLNRIDEMSTQLKSLHDTVAAQMVSFPLIFKTF